MRSINAQGGTRPPSTPRSEFAESHTPAVALLAQGSAVALVAWLAFTALACTPTSVDVAPAAKNRDGQTRYCDVCRADVPAQSKEHQGPEAQHRTSWCPRCKREVSTAEHLHGRDQWCGEAGCGFSAAYEGKDHHHAKTRFCPTCRGEAQVAEGGEIHPDHQHFKTLYCEPCDREMAVDEKGRHGHPKHGQTAWCRVCGLEVERTLKEHGHFKTAWCYECEREAGVTGHVHKGKAGETNWCHVCGAEIPLEPGETTNNQVKWEGGDKKLKHDHNTEVLDIEGGRKTKSLGSVQEQVNQERAKHQAALQGSAGGGQ